MMIADWVGEIRDRGYCVVRGHLARPLVDACRDAFWPILLRYLEEHGNEPNRGTHRHFLPMPFEPPCFVPEFFFDGELLSIVRGMLGERIVADQWGCDVPVRGSEYQQFHIDYQRPLFEEAPDLPLPVYLLVVSFGLVPITAAHGPLEIVPGTHRRPLEMETPPAESVLLDVGDVLIRHPWALHRGTPNVTDMPRALATVRYARRWYTDRSREVNSMPRAVWETLTAEQRTLMRFPLNSRSVSPRGR